MDVHMRGHFFIVYCCSSVPVNFTHTLQGYFSTDDAAIKHLPCYQLMRI